MLTNVLTISELNRRAREILQQNFSLLWVSGEISNLTRATSGHLYFTLKDEAAQVRCVMFRNRAQLLPWRLENGQQVEANALVTLYEARGEFQLTIEGLRRAGIGALYETFSRLREKLEREGLFAPEKKRALPRFPRCVGIISSPQAAALHDILITLKRRAPHLPVVLYPVPVQGEGSAEKIAAAITLAGKRGTDKTSISSERQHECDVLIVARGGGSIEDLWAFNEEGMARSIAASPIPVVCGIGHETDVTIADFAADQRAATPTAAAELVSAGWFAAARELEEIQRALQRSLRDMIEQRMQRLDRLAHRLVHPGARLAADRFRLDHLATRLRAATAHRQHIAASRFEQLRLRLAHAQPQASISSARARLDLLRQGLVSATRRNFVAQRSHVDTLGDALAHLSPQATLERGYSIVRDQHGAIVRAGSQLASGNEVEMRFAKGWARGTIDESGT